jgi:SSS family transporter
MPDTGVLGGFGWLDWSVVVGFLVLTTVLGERLSGKQSTVHDFFLGGRRLPWFAVAASIIATEISAVTLIGLPAVVFAEGGNLTYLQLGVFGSFVARWTIAIWLVPAYYEREIYSPYDYMGRRLGGNVRGVTSALFALGGVLGQAARVYLIAVVLEVILVDELAWIEARTGIDSLVASVGAIGLVSIFWTLLGGIATVIWTDAILFVVFLAAIGIALVTVVQGVDGGAAEVVRVGGEAGKLRFFDLSATLARPYTLWAALFAIGLGNIGAYGTDQLLAQRLLCCRDVRDARRAIVASYGAMIVTVLVGFVGVGLYAWYRQHPLSGHALELFNENPGRIFPIFVLQAVPPGLKGLILAGAFAAAISSLDSILAALSQTTLASLIQPWWRRRGEADDDRRALRVSRVLVVLFGVLLCALAVYCAVLERKYKSILDLALAMAGYTQGALLAGFLLAFWRLRVNGAGFVWSAPLSVLAVYALAWSGDDLGAAGSILFLVALGALTGAWLFARLGDRRGGVLAPLARTPVFGLGVGLVFWLHRAGVDVSWPWYVPLGCTFALGFGYLLGHRPDPETS